MYLRKKNVEVTSIDLRSRNMKQKHSQQQNFSYHNEFGARTLYTRRIIQMDLRSALLTGSTVFIASLMRSRLTKILL